MPSVIYDSFMVSGVPYYVCLYRRALPELMDEGVLTLQAGDALKDPALEEHAPFDAIHVGASAGHIPKVSCGAASNPSLLLQMSSSFTTISLR